MAQDKKVIPLGKDKNGDPVYGGGLKADYPNYEQLKKATEEQPKEVFIGFDRVAKDMRTKIEKLARQKGISTFSVMGIPQKNDVPKYSGGMVRSPEILVEGLYNMAKQRPEIKMLLEVVVKALNGGEEETVKDIEVKGAEEVKP